MAEIIENKLDDEKSIERDKNLKNMTDFFDTFLNVRGNYYPRPTFFKTIESNVDAFIKTTTESITDEGAKKHYEVLLNDLKTSLIKSVKDLRFPEMHSFKNDISNDTQISIFKNIVNIKLTALGDILQKLSTYELNMKNITIREVTENDYEAIAQLHKDTILNVNSKDYPADTISAWAKQINPERYKENEASRKRWVAEENGQIVGFVGHYLEGGMAGLYVHKDFQGKNIGNRLFKVAMDSQKELGFKDITLRSTLSAVKFYKKQGYEKSGEDFDEIEGKKIDIVLMNNPENIVIPDLPNDLENILNEEKEGWSSFNEKTQLPRIGKSLYEYLKNASDDRHWNAMLEKALERISEAYNGDDEAYMSQQGIILKHALKHSTLS